MGFVRFQSSQMSRISRAEAEEQNVAENNLIRAQIIKNAFGSPTDIIKECFCCTELCGAVELCLNSKGEDITLASS